MNMSDEDTGLGYYAGIVQGVASFLDELFDYGDITAFRTKYHLSIDHNGSGVHDMVRCVPKTQKHSPVGVEASLDIQYITSTGNEIQTEHWSTPGKQPGAPDNEPFVKFLAAVSAAPDAPSVFSMSYGDPEDGMSKSYATRCGTEFMKAGARGISLIAASGDSGVGCALSGFVATFPASCPFVTGVGAVSGGTPGHSPTGEEVADLSGGGFSNIFIRPSYQDAAVKAYLSSAILPEKKNFNADGAGFPDIAGQGIGFDVATSGFFYPISGTSAASPSAAGAFALLAQQRLSAGKERLGWLNPFLYSLGATNPGNAFNDVTTGTNTHCGEDSGFGAAKGWDPVTGFGTLNYGQLVTPFCNA